MRWEITMKGVVMAAAVVMSSEEFDRRIHLINQASDKQVRAAKTLENAIRDAKNEARNLGGKAAETVKVLIEEAAVEWSFVESFWQQLKELYAGVKAFFASVWEVVCAAWKWLVSLFT
jgi:hypothetical protein